ncbi:Rossmann-like and DUF2520 domain-containing protein [Corallococcus macrosporus]|uniref:DUF2520 domain-containing protein n=1 Tax=Corallococcus macrosporus DSM 14697 TaxID=1189310 RepID=A0A250JZD1_9BACT|nr:hypothetical protein MYMAC_004093 [Corallococcus macrosporus DSM 14697]
MSPGPRRRAGPSTRRPPVVVVGVGRLGGALALALQAKRWPVRIHSRTAAGRQRAEALGLKAASPADLKRARVVLLCVPDASVPSVARGLSTTLPRTAALVHTAGALPLDALGTTRGRPRGSFHPLCAVSSPHDSLAGSTVAVSTPSRALRDVLRRMAADAGLRVIEVPEAHRAAYHAGAVLSAGGLVSLADAAVAALGASGIPPADALAALLPLMHSALRGLETRGLAGGLTGPIVRGDSGVVAAHLEALPADVAPLYRLLSRRALGLAGDRLEPTSRAALERLLKPSG